MTPTIKIGNQEVDIEAVKELIDFWQIEVAEASGGKLEGDTFTAALLKGTNDA